MPQRLHCRGYFKHFISSVTWAALSLRAKKLRGPGWLHTPPAEQWHLGPKHRSISPAELLASRRTAPWGRASDHPQHQHRVLCSHVLAEPAAGCIPAVPALLRGPKPSPEPWLAPIPIIYRVGIMSLNDLITWWQN